MWLLLLGAEADAHGAHSYSGPSRGPDEVLDSLRLQASCGIEGSFLDAVQCGRMCKVEQWLTSAWTASSSRMPHFVRMDRGKADDDFSSTRGLNRRECASSAACRKGFDTDSSGRIRYCTLLGRGVTNAGLCRRRGKPGDWTISGQFMFHNGLHGPG